MASDPIQFERVEAVCMCGITWWSRHWTTRGSRTVRMESCPACAMDETRLNGAPATPAERAVIDAAEGWTTAITAASRRIDDRDLRGAAAVAEERIWTAVARLRSERNKTDG